MSDVDVDNLDEFHTMCRIGSEITELQDSIRDLQSQTYTKQQTLEALQSQYYSWVQREFAKIGRRTSCDTSREIGCRPGTGGVTYHGTECGKNNV